MLRGNPLVPGGSRSCSLCLVGAIEDQLASRCGIHDDGIAFLELAFQQAHRDVSVDSYTLSADVSLTVFSYSTRVIEQELAFADPASKRRLGRGAPLVRNQERAAPKEVRPGDTVSEALTFGYRAGVVRAREETGR